MDSSPLNYGLQRLDHAVGNVPNLQEVSSYLMKATGFHKYMEFTSQVIWYTTRMDIASGQKSVSMAILPAWQIEKVESTQSTFTSLSDLLLAGQCDAD